MAEILEQKPDVEKLLSKGAEQKYLTTEEVLAAFPDAESNIDDLDAFYRRLFDMGIEVVEPSKLPKQAREGPGDSEPEAPEDRAEAERDLAVLPLEGVELAGDPVKMYLREIGRVPLLDANQEIQLSIKMAA